MSHDNFTLYDSGVKDSAAISQAIITGGALAGASFALFQAHPLRVHQPLIDFDLALLLIPSLLLGTSIGEIGHLSALSTLLPSPCSACIVTLLSAAVMSDTLHRDFGVPIVRAQVQ